METLYEELTFWEQGLPAGWCSSVPLPNEVGVPQLEEGESVWADEDLPESLSSVFSEVVGDGNFDEWLDERIDLNILENDEMFSLGETVKFLEDIDSPITSEKELFDFNDSTLSGDAIQQINHVDDKKEAILGSGIVVDDHEVVVGDNPFVIESSPSSSLEVPSVTCADEQKVPLTPPPASNEEIIGQQIILFESIDGEMIVEIPAEPRSVMSTSTSNTDSPPPSPLNDSVRKSTMKSSSKSRRSTPYSRSKKKNYAESLSSSDDEEYVMVGGRRERKRDQNRTAASRYRAKKRAEQEVMNDEEAVLLAKNKELSQKVNQLSSEIGYLKGLMREMLISRGLLKK